MDRAETEKIIQLREYKTRGLYSAIDAAYKRLEELSRQIIERQAPAKITEKKTLIIYEGSEEIEAVLVPSELLIETESVLTEISRIRGEK